MTSQDPERWRVSKGGTCICSTDVTIKQTTSNQPGLGTVQALKSTSAMVGSYLCTALAAGGKKNTKVLESTQRLVLGYS